MIGEYLENYTFSYLLNQALSKVPDTIDKREGSIIYDALAPACYELSEYYMNLRKILIDTFAETASEEYLDLRVAEQGIQRYQATYATKKGIFVNNLDLPALIPIGSRFSTVSDEEAVNYYVSEIYTDELGSPVAGAYKLVCEMIGTVGNNYVGDLIPITHINNLKTALMTDLIIPARDIETDEELRTRYFLAINEKPFGGNIAQYDQEIKTIEGVGEIQVYPVWDGGGTVKCSIIDAEYNAISSEFIDVIQNKVDPENVPGQGLGMAPIGHTVTITTPTEVDINISADITLLSGYELVQLQPEIEQVLYNYLLSLRKVWGIGNELNQYSLTVYLARITATILTVTGVANVTSTEINGMAEDLILEQTALIQELPQLGTVILNE
ncbi:baseplate J/gp47 family protein [Globicatella sulfidifaciens]|uniref:Baseplate J/gp47 family protein n=1 Tax=Globicatella sulfidifaciens TaxID=136093 RepID=A0A7X8C3T0_9LACT|nr:baseplate J/gp47 family protein [Globicatella sulfidifaciens]NLJ18481.1 baseplate J/gp47 family protein [Globicatella sulfidifaciens]